MQPKATPHIDVLVEVSKSKLEHLHEINKFNPYHDERGRFSTSSGYASFTIRTRDPKKQHMADMAVAREKERSAGERIDPASRPNDPVTIGGATRGDPMTRDEANNKNANPNFEKGRGFDTNCQSCVVAYEARLRGYDVEAKANFRNPDTKHISYHTNHAWIDPATGTVPSVLKNKDAKTPKQFQEWMESTVKPGERYTFRHAWKGRGSYGHIISVDRTKSGELRLYDPQSGKTMLGSDIDAYMSRTKVSHTPRSGWQKGQTQSDGYLLRVDNLQINPAFADGIMEGK